LQIGYITVGIVFKSRAEMVWVVAASCSIAIAGTGKAVQGVVAETVGPWDIIFAVPVHLTYIAVKISVRANGSACCGVFIAQVKRKQVVSYLIRVVKRAQPAPDVVCVLNFLIKSLRVP
jgi:hypothetical protein